VQGADGQFRDGGAYPASDTDLALALTPDGRAMRGETDDGSAAYADGPTGDAPSSVTFVSEPFEQDTRISGQFGFDVEFSADGPDATTAVTVLDVPAGAEPGDSSTTTMTEDRDQPLVISYAWLRAWYRDSVPLRGLSTPTGGGPVEPGEAFDATFGSLYTDVVVPAGHRLAFRFSSAAGGTNASNIGGDVEIRTGDDVSRVLVPVVSEGEDDRGDDPGGPPGVDRAPGPDGDGPPGRRGRG
jgi:hypothetical protein